MRITSNDQGRYDISGGNHIEILHGSQKSGVAGYNWFIGPILSVLGFAVSIKDDTGKTFYLNKKSAIKWLDRKGEHSIPTKIKNGDLCSKIKKVASNQRVAMQEYPKLQEHLSDNELVSNVEMIFTRGQSPGVKIVDQDAKPDLSSPIPVQTGEEAENILQGGGVRGAESPYYSPERTDRHINAQAPLHYLYNLGAKLINNGLVANAQPKALEDVPSSSSDVAVLASSSGESAERAIAIQLKAAYEAIPQTTGYNGSHAIQNSFRALFPILVGLDNVKPENIVEVYKKVNADSNLRTMGFHSVELPNGSQFGADEVIQSILYYYMIARPDTFNSMIKFDIRDVQEASTYVMTGFGQDIALEKVREFMAIDIPTSLNLLESPSAENLLEGEPKIEVLEDE